MVINTLQLQPTIHYYLDVILCTLFANEFVCIADLDKAIRDHKSFINSGVHSKINA